MPITKEVGASKHPVVERYARYLNGPMGKKVLENLDEGESFILQTSEHTLRVTKRNSRAIVNLLSIS